MPKGLLSQFHIKISLIFSEESLTSLRVDCDSCDWVFDRLKLNGHQRQVRAAITPRLGIFLRSSEVQKWSELWLKTCSARKAKAGNTLQTDTISFRWTLWTVRRMTKSRFKSRLGDASKSAYFSLQRKPNLVWNHKIKKIAKVILCRYFYYILWY